MMNRIPKLIYRILNPLKIGARKIDRSGLWELTLCVMVFREREGGWGKTVVFLIIIKSKM